MRYEKNIVTLSIFQITNLKITHMKKIVTLISILLVTVTLVRAQSTPNAGFESWTSHSSIMGSYDTPDSGWSCSNSQTSIIGIYSCYKSTSAHSGTYAIELITKSIGSPFNVLVPGIATTGTIPSSISGSITGGIAYTLRPDSITGWYKYSRKAEKMVLHSLFYLAPVGILIL